MDSEQRPAELNNGKYFVELFIVPLSNLCILDVPTKRNKPA